MSTQTDLEAKARAAWEAGFSLAINYGDNYVHCQGEQRERQWKAHWDSARSLTQPKEGLSDAEIERHADELYPNIPEIPKQQEDRETFVLHFQYIRDKGLIHSEVDQLAPTADIRFDEFMAAAKARGYPMLTDMIEAHDKMKSQPPLDIPEAIKSLSFIKEIGERGEGHGSLRSRIISMVKWANHGIASLTQQPK